MARPSAKEAVHVKFSPYRAICKCCKKEVAIEVSGTEHFRRDLEHRDAHWRHCKAVYGK